MIKEFDYDLKDEIKEFRLCGAEHLYKFLRYKSSSLNFECDRCKYARKIYEMLWGFDSKKSGNFQIIRVGSQEILMGMDTINSFFITFKKSLNNWCKEELKAVYGISKVTAKSSGVFLKNYFALKEMIINHLSEEIFEKLNLFAKLTHTIGNFTLVPKVLKPHTKNRSFNLARASKWNDYFDLSLIWFINNEEPAWTEETVEHYAQMFYLEDYIRDGSIIPYNERHKRIIDGEKNLDSRPQTIEELSTLLDCINERIVARGKAMHEQLTGKPLERKSHGLLLC